VANTFGQHEHPFALAGAWTLIARPHIVERSRYEPNATAYPLVGSSRMPNRRRAPVRRHRSPKRVRSLPKAPTGIVGFDDITGGGLPRGRPTLVAGGPGCGKTLFGLQFLMNGALKFDEPGVFVTFEETPADLELNVRSLGYDLPQLIKNKQIAVEHVRVERAEIEETGEYNLEALFIRLDDALRSVKGKRIVLDTIESLFGGLADTGVLRAELRRLFSWLKERRITAVITGEKGDTTLTRQGLEEYVSDCVIALDHRVIDQISTRRLRVVKYRGSSHGTNEYPFLIDRDGIAVLPVTSLRLQHAASTEHVSSGLEWLDRMLDGQGYFRGSSVLLSGGAGTGKTSVAGHFLESACRAGHRALCFVFEESPAQFARNMRSIGIDLERWTRKGLLRIHAARPTLYGLEVHLATMHRDIEQFQPAVVVVDPLTSFSGGTFGEIHATLIRLIDYLKTLQVTAIFTHLIPGTGAGVRIEKDIEAGVSSLMDTWILLRNTVGGDAHRQLVIVKSRGMPHSAEERSFRITSAGLVAVDEQEATASSTRTRGR
jgi:circadian clock protein KaiC